jgi:magnesium chelatase family protein
MHVVLPPLDVAQLQGTARGETSSDVQKRVVAARALQAERMRTAGTARINAELSSKDLERCATPDTAGAKVLAQAVERLGLSTRDYGRVLRVARTIADLDGSEGVRGMHIAEAIAGIAFPEAKKSDASA